MEIRTEIYCHECDKYVQFTLDDELDGNHIIICPNCGHEHCRVIKKGKVTGDRWDSRNGQTYYVSSSTITYSSTSSEIMYFRNSSQPSSATTYTYASWMNSTTAG